MCPKSLAQFDIVSSIEKKARLDGRIVVLDVPYICLSLTLDMQSEGEIFQFRSVFHFSPLSFIPHSLSPFLSLNLMILIFSLSHVSE